MKKTLIAFLALAGSAVATTDVHLYADNQTVTLDPSVSDYRLLFYAKTVDGKDPGDSYTITTVGDQTIAEQNAYETNKVLMPITLNLGGKLTSTSGWKNMGNGVPITINMGELGSVEVNGAFSLCGSQSTLALTTTTSTETLLADANPDHFYSRDLITCTGNEASVWYSVNGTSGNYSTTVTLRDSALEAAGFSYVGALSLAADGSYTDLNGNAVTLDSMQYAVLFSRADYRLGNAAEKMTLIAQAPEPATATLSLLALAGLCARRRRH